MAHLRKRWIMEKISGTVAWSPAVGVYGLRQVGKSTLVEAIVAEKSGAYETFDRGTTAARAQNRPYEFCERGALLCLDECQKAPWLFPVIKDIIGTKRKPGRFLLTGSVRFTLKKEIQEALSGRIVLFELLPFTLAEAGQLSPSPFLATCLGHLFHNSPRARDNSDSCLEILDKAKRDRGFDLKQIAKHLTTGGLPMPCFTRDPEKRRQWYEGFFETLIARDLPLVDPSLEGILPAQGISLLRRLAFMQGEELNYAALATASALSLNKAKGVLRALVALCLIDLFIPESHATKSQKKMRVEWKDAGLWNYFSQISADSLQDNHTAMSLFLTQELRFQQGSYKFPTQWTYYQSHNGANVPWIFRQGKHALALMYMPVENPSPYQYRGLKQFVEQDPSWHGIIFGTEKTPFTQLDHRILLMPFTAMP